VVSLVRRVRRIRTRLMAKRMVTWEDRWGSQAVGHYEHGAELYNGGAVSGTALVLVFSLLISRESSAADPCLTVPA